jgi:hypothetical protein
MARFLDRSAVALVAVIVAACSSAKSPSNAAGSGSEASNGGASSCADRTSQAQSILSAAETQADGDLRCTADSDCVYLSNDTDCSRGCGHLANQAGKATIDAAIARANGTACVGFAKDGCTSYALPCAPPLSAGLTACVSGTCKAFPPAAWTSFAIDENTGTTNVIATPPSCAPGGACRLWTLTPDAKVNVVDAKGTHTATLSAADFATVDAVLRSESFRGSTQAASSCAAVPSGNATWVSFDVSWGTATIGMDETGCVVTGPAGNDAKKVYDVIKGY